MLLNQFPNQIFTIDFKPNGILTLVPIPYFSFFPPEISFGLESVPNLSQEQLILNGTAEFQSKPGSGPNTPISPDVAKKIGHILGPLVEESLIDGIGPAGPGPCRIPITVPIPQSQAFCFVGHGMVSGSQSFHHGEGALLRVDRAQNLYRLGGPGKTHGKGPLSFD
jgi:hypothetical protein